MTSRQISLPAVVGEILDIDVMDITVGDRLRPVDPEWAKALAGIINAEGQRTPIEVCRLPGRKGFTLVAGAHRLEAMRDHLCRVHIAAIIVDADKAERRAREISENLWRKGLDPVDRAAFVAELYELLRAKSGVSPDASAQTIAINAKWQKLAKADAADTSDIMSRVYGWADSIAEKVGVSSKTIYRDLALFRRLHPAASARLRGHPIFNNAGQMQALAKLDGQKQQAVADMIATGAARSVGEALAVGNQKPKPDAETKRLNAVIGNLGRMGASERQAAIDQIAGMYFQATRRAVAKASSFDGDHAE